MENENQTQFENRLTTSAIGFLNESAKWSKLLAIVGFVGIGLMVLFSLLFIIGISAFDQFTERANSPFPMSLLGVVYLIIAAVYFFPVYYLYQFAVKTKAALHTKNTQMLTDGFENLKSHYKFLGIFTLVILSLYGLIFIFAIIAGLFAASN